MVAKSKDVAAGAVLLSAIGAAAVGLLVFVPHLTRIF
jgi:diacylglycerol kinase (ATP)